MNKFCFTLLTMLAMLGNPALGRALDKVNKQVSEKAEVESPGQEQPQDGHLSPGSLAAGNPAIVAVPVARVRTAPSLDSSIIFRLHEEDHVSVLRTRGDWSLVALQDGRTGWAHQSLFSKPPATDEVTFTPVSDSTTIGPPRETAPPSDQGDPRATIDATEADYTLLNLNFVDVDIRQALSAIAMEQEISISTAKDVSGKISIHLFQVTLEQALDAITMAGGFNYLKRGDVYYVYRPREGRHPQSERLQMKIFRLKYADIEQVQEILGTVPGIRMVRLHAPSKTIVVEDTPENIEKIQTIIQYWDTRPKQVMIEAKILSVDLTDDMTLGVDWDKILGDVRIETAGFSDAILPDGLSVKEVAPAPAVGVGLFSNMIIGAGTAHQFAAALDALQTMTKVDTLSTPKVLAVHGKPAKVQVGGQQGYRLTTVNQGISTESIQFIDTGIVLEITTYIDEHDNVLLNVRPSITSATLETGGIPVTNTALVDTWLLAKSGDTVLIGGLIQDSKSKSREEVPCLGSIPGLGLLFGRRSRQIDKSELVVLISLLVLDAKQRPVDEAKASEKIRQMEEILHREPLPLKEKLREFLAPVD